MPITRNIQERIQQIIAHQNTILLEREEVTPCVWANRIAQQHFLMVGGPGTAKSMVARNTFEHITGGYQFETSLDETSDPGVLFGPTDVKAIAEGKGQRRLTEGMLPDATDAFIDEIFNANGPTLRSTQPALNERLYHQGKQAIHIPLKSVLAGTNQLTKEPRLMALWDRFSQRHVLEPLREKESQLKMAAQTVERLDKRGRGKVTEIETDLVTVSIEELDIAHHEALKIGVSDEIFLTYYELREKLRDEGSVEISDRRFGESLVTVLANAWVRGHEEVVIGDLDILTHMWWEDQDQRLPVRGLILDVVNPADKVAMDGFETLKVLKQEAAEMKELDSTRMNHVGVEIQKNTGKLISQANDTLIKANTEGWPTEKLERLIAQCDNLLLEVSQTFGLGAPGSLAVVR